MTVGPPPLRAGRSEVSAVQERRRKHRAVGHPTSMDRAVWPEHPPGNKRVKPVCRDHRVSASAPSVGELQSDALANRFQVQQPFAEMDTLRRYQLGKCRVELSAMQTQIWC